MKKNKLKFSVNQVPATEPPKPTSQQPAPWYFLSMEDWRNSATRVSWMTALQKDATFREFLGMLHYESKTRARIPVTTESIALEFGRSEGRSDVLEMIELSAQPAVGISGVDGIPLDYGIAEKTKEK